MTTEFEWNEQQELILKKWAEIASCYQWMHDRAYRVYREKNIRFALPVIIISTVTGTANFAQQSFPEEWKHYFIMGIGTLNLLAGLITTISQFLRINELQEGYRVAEVGFSKLSRNIEVILDLPIKYRNVHGDSFLESCKQEYDRLIEQSPIIPKNIVLVFNKKFKKKKFAKPNLISISEISIFHEEPNTEVKLTDEEKEHHHTMRKLKALHEQMSTITNIKQKQQESIENDIENNNIEIEMVEQNLLSPSTTEKSTKDDDTGDDTAIDEDTAEESTSGDDTGSDKDIV